MLRLTALLCASMFVTLLLAGEDRGQLRPGLAQAVAQGQEIVVLERRRAAPVEPAPAETAPKTILEAAAEDSPVVSAAYVPPPAPAAASESAPAPAPVFTLSALPSLGGDRVDADAPLPSAAPETPVAAPEGGEVWYVTASSVNVREAPSTEAGVLGKLGTGEAVTVVALPDGDWAQIVIEGDGIQGYVAARFLSPDAP